MPTYEYRCKECGHEFEAVQAFSDDSLTECPVCQGALRKVFGNVGITFKGSGFYKNDSRATTSKGSSGDSPTTSDKSTKEGSSGDSSSSTAASTTKDSGSGGSGSGSSGSASPGSTSGDSSSSAKPAKPATTPA